MIPAHQHFLEALHAKQKVCVRFYSNADSGVIDRVCAPLDYGPGDAVADGLNRYWFSDPSSKVAPRTLGLLPDQILDLRVLGEVFDPATLDARLSEWTIPRNWGLTSQQINKVKTKILPALPPRPFNRQSPLDRPARSRAWLGPQSPAPVVPGDYGTAVGLN